MPCFGKLAGLSMFVYLNYLYFFVVKTGGGVPCAIICMLSSMLGATGDHKIDHKFFALKELPAYSQLLLYFYQFLPSLKVLLQC